MGNYFELKEQAGLEEFVKWFEKIFDGDVDRFEKCLRAYRLFKGEVGIEKFIEMLAISKYGKEWEMIELKRKLGLIK